MFPIITVQTSKVSITMAIKISSGLPFLAGLIFKEKSESIVILLVIMVVGCMLKSLPQVSVLGPMVFVFCGVYFLGLVKE